MNARQSTAPAPAFPMSIQALSDAMKAGHVQSALFSSDRPNNLAELVQEMEKAGYQISAPVKAPHAPRVSGRVAWQLMITTPESPTACAAVGGLLIYVPEDAS